MKFFNNKNRWTYSLWIFNVSNLGIWSHRIKPCFISRKRLHEKVLWIFKRTREKYKWFKKKMLPLRRKESKSFKDANVCYVSRIKFLKNPFKNMNYWKLRGHCHYAGKYRGAAHSICNLKFNVPNEILASFHNSSNYDYYFIIKESAN